MIYLEHTIEIYVNGQRLELESQDSLNLRFNDVLSDPTKISSTQAEYSFEFDVPSTPNNDRIFDYANNLAKTNKFHHRYNAEVYGDGTLIFSGTLTLNSVKEKKYSCNLVSVKIYSLEDIFGDMTMNKIKWEIPFEGAGDGTYSIDWWNRQAEAEVTFPIASYGVFQKDPYNEDEVAKDFTNKFYLDKWNRWYVESFYPSPNVLITLKKAFESVDYNVSGDIFHNPYLTRIYASGNLADEQVPTYNLGNPKFGEVNLSTTFTTSGQGYEQELDFPYFKINALLSTDIGLTSQTEYNWSNIFTYDILESGVTVNQSVSYMYQPNEHIIVIPADGFYKIEMYVNSTLNTTGSITAAQKWVTSEKTLVEQDVTLPVGLLENTPLEIALVRNYEDNYELIKGKNNKKYRNGNPTEPNNSVEWMTCFPHEDLYNAELPTEKNDLSLYHTTSRFQGQRSTYSGNREEVETRGGTTNHSGNSERRYTESSLGYVYKDGDYMCYDQAVSPIFICGFSSFLGGKASVMKNGYSWSKITPEKNESFYPLVGYDFINREAGTGDIVATDTSYNRNGYINTPVIAVCNASDTTMNGQLSCIVHLNKNDVLQLMAIHRGWYTEAGNYVTYQTTNNVQLKISAFSPRSYDQIKSSYSYDYYAPTEFPTNLQVANFFNSETLVSEWVQGILNAFNLQLTQNGTNIDICTKKSQISNYAVEFDNRVNTAEAESERIDYPKSMAVKYRINEDEWGFERSAVASAGGDESILNDDDWKKYADSGFTDIELNDDTYITDKSETSLPFSYSWYDNFTWFEVNQSGEETQNAIILRLPVISNYSYMINGYDYEESMKHDGFGLPQRFWYKPEEKPAQVWTETYPKQSVTLFVPNNTYNGLNLSYKTSEKSLLDVFFDIKAYLGSNYVNVEAYITPEEYKAIKNGALIHFDSDIYVPIEVSGYDPTGNEATSIKMMKRMI